MNNFFKQLILITAILIILYSCTTFHKIQTCNNYKEHVLYFKYNENCNFQYLNIHNAFKIYKIQLINIGFEKKDIPLLNIIDISKIIKKIEFSDMYHIVEYQVIFSIKAELFLDIHQKIPIDIRISRTYIDRGLSPYQEYQKKVNFIAEIYSEAIEILIQKYLLLRCKNFCKI
ncbi:MAG: RlpB family protein [Wigglesworthia glossinidia]|nr:RlpB family protein [Wigglesworthia glossinidia]